MGHEVAPGFTAVHIYCPLWKARKCADKSEHASHVSYLLMSRLPRDRHEYLELSTSLDPVILQCWLAVMSGSPSHHRWKIKQFACEQLLRKVLKITIPSAFKPAGCTVTLALGNFVGTTCFRYAY